MRTVFVLFLSLFFFSASPSQAGQLFPPENASGATTCPSGQVLKWVDNSVKCEDPSPGVNVTACPTGKVLMGVNSGNPNCQAPPPSTLTVTCPDNHYLKGISNGGPVCVPIPTPNPTPVNVSCPAGYVLSGISNNSPVCTNNNGAFGGTYGGGMGMYVNPLTGARSCPAGYHPVRTSHGTNSCYGCVWYTCYRD